MRIAFLLLSLLVFGALPATAQFAPTSGPEGGWFGALVTETEDQPLAFALTGRGFRLSEGGWQPVGSPGDFPFAPVAREGVLLTLTLDGMRRSTDGGRSWQPTQTVVSPALLAASGDHFYAAQTPPGEDREELYRSRDGRTWTRAARTFEAHLGASITPFSTFDGVAALGDTLFASAVAGETRGVFRLVPGAAHWQPVAIAMGQTSGVLYTRDDTLYTGSQGGARSDDGGRTWATLQAEPTASGHAPTFYRFASGEGALLAASFEGLYRLEGTRWVLTNVTGRIFGLTAAGRTVHASTREGLFRSTDGGLTFAAFEAGLVATGTRVVSTREALFTLTDGGFLYRSDDGGQAWSGRYDLNARRLVAHEQVLIAGGEDGLLRSEDGGRTWHLRNHGVLFSHTQADRTPALLASGGEVLLLGFGADTRLIHDGRPVPGGLYRSTDAGLSWERATRGVPAQGLGVYALATEGGDALAATTAGLLRSTDSGRSWQHLRAPFTPSSVGRIFFHEGDLYVLARRGLFRLERGGFIQLTRGGRPDAGFYELSEPLVLEGRLLLVGPGAAYEWREQGWRQRALALPQGVVWTGFAQQGAHIFAGTTDRGVWRVSARTLLTAAAAGHGNTAR